MIIDSHTHLLTSPSDWWEGYTPVYASPEEAMEVQRSCGIDGMVFTSWKAIMGDTAELVDQGNTETLSLYDAHKDFLYPGLEMNPLFPELSRRWMKEFRSRGLVWAGEWIPTGKRGHFNSPEFDALARECAENDMILQLHNSPGVPDIARKYPEMTIVASHLTWEFLEQEVELPNVYVDVSGMCGGLWNGSLKRAKSMFGVDRLLYGTDFDGYDPECFLMRCRRDFTPEEQQKLFAGNLLGLLKKKGVKSIFNMTLE